jgi:cytochrome c
MVPSGEAARRVRGTLRTLRSWRFPLTRPLAAILVAASTSGLAASSTQAGDRELGQYLSSECVTCHQLSGRFQGIPPIVGWPEASFVEIMNEYRAKKRDNPVMQTIAGKFSQEEIAALAAYFGNLRPQPQ